MEAASIDGPYGLRAACPIFNIEMYCDVDYWANKMLACLQGFKTSGMRPADLER